MAFREDGTYYFNPELDVADKQALEETDRLEQAMLYKRAQLQNQAAGKFQAEAWNEVLADAGIDQATYARLHAEDPAATQELIKESMKIVAKGVAGRKNKRPQPKAQTPGAQPQQPEQAPDERANERLETARETINKRPLSNDEELDILGAVLGDNFKI